MTNQVCACGSNRLYSVCCEPILLGKKSCETAEQLMRSRYSAFTKCDVNYLMRSQHSSTRSKADKTMLRWMKSVQWLSLTIVDVQAGLVHDSSGYVEFRAVYMEDNKVQVIHERSLFERENGSWVYVSGVHN